MKQTTFPRTAAALLTVLLLAACAESAKDNMSDRVSRPVAASPEPLAGPSDAAPSESESAPAAPMAAQEAEAPSRAMNKNALSDTTLSSDYTVIQQQPEPGDERYGKIDDNPVKLVAEEPVSTFSIDVDTGSYANVRRMLTHGQLPPRDAVRVEEMINYFPYRYAQPRDGKPFAVHTALAPAPWNADRVLLRVALKGEDLAKQTLPPANLIFLVDVSGSMYSRDKLPLLQASLKLLVKQLRAQDRISLVTYAGGTAVALSGAPGSEQKKIINAISRLRAGGSTAGAAGIELAYQQAQENFIKGGINRILLATDGDFNIGVTDFGQLKQMIEDKRKSGVSFTTLGFGTGNYNEHLMEQLADAGNGAYSYIDSLMEGKKVLVNEMTSTLATIAKDVKIQVEFNPAQVTEYRLIGYENRMLKREDFNNDKVDAGDIGAGHTVTALYELTLAGRKGALEPLRYQTRKAASADAHGDEIAFVKLRYKKPDGDTSTLAEYPVLPAELKPIKEADDDFRLAAAVAGFGQLLRDRANLGSWRYENARALAASVTSKDEYGYRAELVNLIELADTLSSNGK
ncbi:MAG: VWA domain-containing protein [Azoarcus sp.]|jgi:Ca-activated chloride channel family protein|nr:VWA domain-containing protein [Azoarcus sp.]